MKLDFLGEDPLNQVTGEKIRLDGNKAIVARGFFFSDEVTIYDVDGEKLDRNSYSFDLPIPSISSRTGRLIFGRIIINSKTPPATVDYRTPYYIEDNRFADIVRYHNHASEEVSTDYYDHASGLFKSGINELKDSTVRAWMTALDNLISAWRNRNIDYDIILDKIDEVFTRGIIRYPVETDLSGINSPTFIHTEHGGNSLNLTKWVATWDISGNLFEIDYRTMQNDLASRYSRFKENLEYKYTGDIDGILKDLQDIDPADSAVVPVATLGTKEDDTIYFGQRAISFGDYDLPDYYVGLTQRLALLNTTCDDAKLAITRYTSLDQAEIHESSSVLTQNLLNGYTESDIEITPEGNLRIDEIVFTGGYTREDLEKDISTLPKVSHEPSSGTLEVLGNRVENLEEVDPNSLIADLSPYSIISPSLLVVLDSLCLTKEILAISVGESSSIGDIL